MLIEVDNLNEALDTTDESNKPIGNSRNRQRNKFICSYGLEAMIKKYDTNKYVVSITR